MLQCQHCILLSVFLLAYLSFSCFRTLCMGLLPKTKACNFTCADLLWTAPELLRDNPTTATTSPHVDQPRDHRPEPEGDDEQLTTRLARDSWPTDWTPSDESNAAATDPNGTGGRRLSPFPLLPEALRRPSTQRKEQSQHNHCHQHQPPVVCRSTQKADVYAFAICLYEILGRRGPYGNVPLSPEGQGSISIKFCIRRPAVHDETM